MPTSGGCPERRHHLPTRRSSSRAIRARGTVCRQDSRLLRHVSAQPAAIIETASTPTGTIEAPVAAMDWFLSLPAFLSASLSVFGFWPSPGVVVPGSSPGPDSGWDPGPDQASASGQDRDQDQASDPGRGSAFSVTVTVTEAVTDGTATDATVTVAVPAFSAFTVPSRRR